MMHIEVIQESRITQSLDAEIRELLCLCFPKDRDYFSKSRYWNQVASEYTVLCRKDTSLIAQVSVIDRDILIGDGAFRIAGIGNVCVHPDCRGQGVSGKLLAGAMEEAADRGYDFGFLFCKTAIEHIYANLGWKPVNAPDIIRIDPAGNEEDFQQWRNKDMAMYYPLSKKTLPPGIIHLKGINW